MIARRSSALMLCARNSTSGTRQDTESPQRRRHEPEQGADPKNHRSSRDYGTGARRAPIPASRADGIVGSAGDDRSHDQWLVGVGGSHEVPVRLDTNGCRRAGLVERVPTDVG